MNTQKMIEKLYAHKGKGALCLVPTPLSEEGKLDPVALELLLFASPEKKDESLFVIEDLKPGRKRWLHFGLPRECVDHFVLYNEHTARSVAPELLAAIKSGKKVFLMSDGGLPAFYDPGMELVNLCHENRQQVTSTPLANSVALALALSGFSHKKFWFEGFLPMDQEERKQVIKDLLRQKHTAIVMDTPYRLKRVLEEFQEAMSGSRKKIFLAVDLNTEREELLRGTSAEITSRLSDFKREFVLILSE